MFGPQSQLQLFPAGAAVAPRSDADLCIRESARARRLSIKVYPHGRVEVVVPRRTRPSEVSSFVDENRDWIARARESLTESSAAEDFELPTRIELPAIGETVDVRYRAVPGNSSVRYRCHDKTLILSGRVGDDTLCRATIRRWLAKKARQALSPRLARLSKQAGLGYNKLHIRMQKTCWGSHSASGTISLNLCLLFLEPRLLRYLMIHELCHARHMNHSRRFWRLVGRYEPDYRRLDRALGNAWRQIPPWLGIY